MPEDCLLGPPELNSGPSQALVSLSIRDQQEIGKRDCRWDQKGGADRPGLVDMTFFFPDKDKHYILRAHEQIHRSMDNR